MEASSYQVQSAIAAKKNVNNRETNPELRTPEVSGVAPIYFKQDEREAGVTGRASAIAAKKTVNNKETNPELRTPEVSGVAPVLSKQDEREAGVTRGAGKTFAKEEDESEQISLHGKKFNKEQEKPLDQ